MMIKFCAALSLSIPFAEIADVFFNHERFQIEYIFGSLFVFIGFVLANLQFQKDEQTKENIQNQVEGAESMTSQLE